MARRAGSESHRLLIYEQLFAHTENMAEPFIALHSNVNLDLRQCCNISSRKAKGIKSKIHKDQRDVPEDEKEIKFSRFSIFNATQSFREFLNHEYV